MKKIFAIFVFALMIYGAGAVTSDLQDSYKQKQTVAIKLTGEILQNIENNQVALERGNSFVAFDRGAENINDVNYLWFVTPSSEGAYKLVVRNIQTTENGQTKLVDYEKNFNITNESEEYYVTPGVEAASADFYITAVNNKDFPLSVQLSNPDRQFALMPGVNKIKFLIKDFQAADTNLKIGKYSVIAKVYGAQNQTGGELNNSGNASVENTSDANASTIFLPGNVSFEFETPVIKANLPGLETKVNFTFRIKNTGDKTLKNLKFVYNKAYFFVYDENKSIMPNESAEFRLNINKSPNNYFRDAILVQSENFSSYMIVILEVAGNQTNSSVEYVPQNQSSSFYYCSEIDKDAKICKAEETCSGTEVDSLDGQCCIGNCQSENKTSTSSWIGYLIALVVIAAGIFIFMKYRKTNSNKESVVKSKFLSAEKKLP